MSLSVSECVTQIIKSFDEVDAKVFFTLGNIASQLYELRDVFGGKVRKMNLHLKMWYLVGKNQDMIRANLPEIKEAMNHFLETFPKCENCEEEMARFAEMLIKTLSV
jgi:hypothetical protein